MSSCSMTGNCLFSNFISNSRYLPSAGELTLLWELQKTGVICKDKQDCFNDFTRKGYWSSSEHSAESAWYLNFVSGAIVANSKASNYATRPVAQF